MDNGRNNNLLSVNTDQQFKSGNRKNIKNRYFFKKKFFLFLHNSSKFVIALKKKKKIIFKFLKILNPHQDIEYRRMIFFAMVDRRLNNKESLNKNNLEDSFLGIKRNFKNNLLLQSTKIEVSDKNRNFKTHVF